MLHHLQDFQLGPPDDVSADRFGEQLLFMVACDICICNMAGVGDLRVHISRKILGKQQYGAQML